jgi:ribonuclease HI
VRVADRTRPRRQPRRKGGTKTDGERRQLARASRHADPAAPLPSDRALLMCDGGSRGNPGPAAVAAVLLAPGGAVIQTASEPIGRATAAEAEYRAILLGLELAIAHGADPVEVRSDSRLAIAAVERRAPDDAGLAALVHQIRSAARGFSAVRWRWHPRGDNEAADALVRELLWQMEGGPARGPMNASRSDPRSD